MDDDLVAGILLVLFGLFLVLERWSIVPTVLLQDIWSVLLIIVGLFFLYLYFRKNPKVQRLQ